MPWLQVAAIVVAATVAGLLASVLPARRAARTPPVAALAS
jgi:putative ABC transport system permease protein